MQQIYLDHASATPMRPEVRSAMAPFFEAVVGNPSSVHRWGREARSRLEGARERLAELVGVAPGEVHFVRGGTESINLAILGTVDARAPGTLLRSSLEHSAVRESMDAAAGRGWTVDTLDVGPDASISLPDPPPVRASDAALASVQWVNHETGLVLPIQEVARWAERSGIVLHVDAVQAMGVPGVGMESVSIGMMSISAHKLGGPRGTGALILREGIELRPRLFGGGQEAGIRPGTEDVAGAVGFVRALEIVIERREEEALRLESLRDRLEEGLRERIPGLRVHGSEGPRAPHILNVGVEGPARDVLPGALDLEGVGASAGSACRSGSSTVSPVLESLYGAAAGRVAPLRFSLGWSTTSDEIDEAIRLVAPVVERAAALEVGA